MAPIQWNQRRSPSRTPTDPRQAGCRHLKSVRPAPACRPVPLRRQRPLRQPPASQACSAERRLESTYLSPAGRRLAVN